VNDLATGTRCSTCGSVVPPGFKFCGHCGAPQEILGVVSAGARRWVTALFADLEGFTSASEQLDPEEVRTLVHPGMQRLIAIVEHYGGWVNRVMGDGLLALFGAPQAHEDDPERAVRCALEMQECARTYADDFGRLRLRVGVHTGDVLFGTVGREITAMGDVVNTASRLQTAAEPGTVFVGIDTWRATNEVIEYEDVGALAVKGKREPVPAWRACEATSEPGARILSRSPMLGRDGELSTLLHAFELTGTTRRPHLATLLGPAGIGKSKLAREFVKAAQARGAQAFSGRTLPYGENSGYGAFAQLVKQITGVFDTDSPTVARDKLAAFGGSEIAPGLAALVGVANEEVNRSQLFEAARTLVELISREQTTVLVLEDLHWAEGTVVELVQWLAARVRDSPVLLLAIARSELLDQYPEWARGLERYTALGLGPLDDRAVHQFVDQLVSDTASLDQIYAHVTHTAAGNPLFIEELVSWLNDTSEAEHVTVPRTVRAIIAARLDALPSDERTALLHASVVGDTFWIGSLEALGCAQPALDNALEQLERRDIVRQERRSQLSDEVEIRFRHNLIREVAYETLPHVTRKELHRSVAEYLERKGVGESMSAVLGLHWRQAGDNEKAVHYLVEAADQAARLYGQALELIDPSDARLRRTLQVKRGLSRQAALHAEVDFDQLIGGKSLGEMSPPIS
jgi:class 3 adenylate cyclase